LSRRDFIKVSAIAGGGIMVGFSLFTDAAPVAGTIFSPNAYLSIDGNGLVTLMSPNPEIGQGVKTALPIILAEELDVQWDKVAVDMAPLDPKFGNQIAGGSGAIRGRFMPIRNAGATARIMLISAAAKEWNVPEDECYAENGFVIHKPTGKKIIPGQPLPDIDPRREGMLFAVPARPPAFGKTLKSFDDTETRKVTGVK